MRRSPLGTSFDAIWYLVVNQYLVWTYKAVGPNASGGDSGNLIISVPNIVQQTTLNNLITLLWAKTSSGPTSVNSIERIFYRGANLCLTETISHQISISVHSIIKFVSNWFVSNKLKLIKVISMSYEKSGKPTLTPRKSKGSITQTYEFPYMINQKDERTLAQQIYDSKTGKFLGRNRKSWGESERRVCTTLKSCYHNISLNLDATTSHEIMFVFQIINRVRANIC